MAARAGQARQRVAGRQGGDPVQVAALQLGLAVQLASRDRGGGEVKRTQAEEAGLDRQVGVGLVAAKSLPGHVAILGGDRVERQPGTDQAVAGAALVDLAAVLAAELAAGQT